MTKDQTPTNLPPLPKPAYLVAEDSRRHGMHPCYLNEQNVVKYGHEGVYCNGFTTEQMLAYAHAARAPTALGAIDHETERAAFEAWATDEGGGGWSPEGMRQRWSDGDYRVLEIRHQWLAWQARAALAPAAPAANWVQVGEQICHVDTCAIPVCKRTRRCHNAGLSFADALGTAVIAAAPAPARASVPQEPAAITEWRKARTASIAAVETYNIALIAARKKDETHGFGFTNVNAEYAAMTEASNLAHRLMGPALDALYATPPVPHASVDQAEPTPAAARDAARYRWLRDIGDATWLPMGKRPGCSAALVDAAIDAALASPSPQLAASARNQEQQP